MIDKSGFSLTIVVSALTALLAGMASQSLQADVWVFEPSVALDQRFDDNYYLLPTASESSLSATRAVGELGFSRQSQIYSIKGIARVDALLITETDVGEENLDSNQILGISGLRRTKRSRYGARFNFTRDTPSRDIGADISDDSSIAEDTGLDEVQSLYSNVIRNEFFIDGTYEFDLTRRLSFDALASYTDVDHGLPSTEDVILQSFLDFRQDLNPDASPTELTDADIFTVDGELDDFIETQARLGLRYALTPISTLSVTANYSRQVSQIEVESAFEFKTPDSSNRFILRNPRRDAITETSTLSLGYERQLTPLLRIGVTGGVYLSEGDVTDTFTILREDLRDPEDDGTNSSTGFLASINLRYDAGLTKYAARFAVDVEPSSTGDQIETNELTGEAIRTLSPRLKVSLRGRAFEPDRLQATVDDRFARRFISIEPKVQWQYTRNWTVTAAYRYRRQRARIDPESSDSNAVLFAIKYSPPSKVGLAAAANGL